MGELGGLLAVQLSSPRCNRLRLSQRQDGRLLPLLLLLLLGIWMTAGPAEWLRVMATMVLGSRGRALGRVSTRDWLVAFCLERDVVLKRAVDRVDGYEY